MLVTLKEVLQYARERNCAIGAFNTPNLESIKGVIEAAELLDVPVIIQHAEAHEHLIKLEEIGPIMIQYAKNAKIPVVVHLDHGESFEACVKAMNLGFTSVMYDASTKSYWENVTETQEIVKIAHALGVTVEAELGHMQRSSIGGGEGRSTHDIENVESLYTDSVQAKDFVELTGVDCLAISFGTVHGVYLTEPKLDLERVKEIEEQTKIPLVMHGGSGIGEEDYKRAIKNGIRKINYYTYMNLEAGNKVKELMESKDVTEKIFFDELALAAISTIRKNVEKVLRIFSLKD